MTFEKIDHHLSRLQYYSIGGILGLTNIIEDELNSRTFEDQRLLNRDAFLSRLIRFRDLPMRMAADEFSSLRKDFQLKFGEFIDGQWRFDV